MSPRWFDKRTGDHLALDTGGGALARLWATALAEQGRRRRTSRRPGSSVQITLPRDAEHARDRRSSGRSRSGPTRSSATGRGSTSSPTRAGMALHFVDKALAEVPRAATSKVFEDFDVPDEAIGCGFHEAVRGVLSHHLVIRDGKIANYHPYPPTPWNGSPTDSYGTPGPVRGRGHGTCRSSRRTARTTSAASTSCGRCAASTRACRAACTCTSATARRCKQVHSPMFGEQHGRLTVDRPVASVEELLERARGPARSGRARDGDWSSCRRCSTSTARGSRGSSRVAERDDGDARALADDELVAHLLLLHGLHPVPLEERVRGALDGGAPVPRVARRRASSCSGSTSGVVRLQLQGSCSGCPSRR